MNETSHRPDRRRVIQGLAGSAVALAWPALRAEDGFPSKPITIIVPATPGGLLDTFMRGSAKLAQQFLNNQTIIIDNRPGASLLLGAEAMARIPKGDGYTLTQFTQIYLRMPHMRATPFDPMKDFSWIIEQVGSPFGIAVRTESPYKTIEDLMADAKARPGAVSYATVGIGNGGHLMMEELARIKALKFNLIPVKGSTEAIQGVLGGHFDCMADSVSWAPHVASGKMRLLLQFNDGRLKRFPDAPSAKERGIPLVYTSPIGVIGPKGMDPQVVKTLHDAFKKASELSEYRELMDKYELFPVYRNSADFAANAREEFEREREMVLRLGLNKPS